MKRMSQLIALVGLLTFFAFVRIATRESVVVRESKKAQILNEGAEDPIARAQQEWMQLRDPYTKEIPKNIRSKELAYARTLPSVEAFTKSSLQKSQLLSWTSRGPVNQGGRTRALAFDLSDATGNTILAGGVSGGMWRSTNGGTSWARSSSLSDSIQSVTCVAQDSRVGHQNVWYYGTGEFKGNSASGGGNDAFYIGDGLYKSTDAGVSWQHLTSLASWTPQVFDRTSDYVWDVVVDPTNGIVYAALYGEIIRSTDGGASWGQSLSSTSASTFSTYTDITVTSSGVFYAVLSSDGANVGVFRSTTGASASWVNITPASWASSYDRIVLAVAPSNQNLVYFLGETPLSGFKNTEGGQDYWTSFWKYTFLSGDGSGAGGNWVDRSLNLPAYGPPVGNFTHQHSYDLVVKVKPDNPNFVFIGGTNLYRSGDGFATTANTVWIGGYATANDISSYQGQHSDEHSLAFKPGSPGILLSGNDGGISKTTNDSTTSVSWTFLNNGYATSQFYSVAIDMATSGDQTVIGGMQDNGNMFTTSTIGSSPWGKMPGGGDGCISAVANGRTYYYIATQNGHILRLVPQADYSLSYTWTVVTPSAATGFLFVAPYVLDPNNSNIMYLAGGNEIWRNSNLTAISDFQSGNATTNWTGLTNTTITGHNLTAIGISTSPSNRLYYGTDSTQIFRVDNANTATVSTNPTPITGVNFPAGGYVSCIAANPRNADTAIVVFSNYNVLSLFFTTNGGTSWSSIGGNLEQNPDGSGNGPSCRWATILPKGSAIQVYVATSTGLYSTNAINGMSTVWALEGSSVIGNVVTTMVLSRPSDGLVVASTHANGVFGAQAITDVQAQSAPMPQTFSLAQNYPNPFNPSTTIEYVVPRTGFVKLNVFDVTGRQIATLAEGTKTPGNYTAVWDGKSTNGIQAASGIYFCRLETAGFSTTRKMVMLK
jgi:hypothetical protein